MIVALVSKKGGVGKTTSTVNLAAALASRGRRVLVVDLDSQGSATLSLGLSRGQAARSAADLLLGGVSAADCVQATSTPNLDLIPASADLIHADFELGSLRTKERRLRDRLGDLPAAYDFVFIDCSPGLTLLPINALVAADRFIVPAVPQYLAWEGIPNLLAAVDRIAGRVGARPELAGILLTMVDYRLKSTRDTADALRAQFGAKVFAVEIRVNVRLAEAPSKGQPIFAYDPSATGAQAYGLLAEELLLRTSGEAPGHPSPKEESSP